MDNPTPPDWLVNYCELHSLSIKYAARTEGDPARWTCWEFRRKRDDVFVASRFITRTQEDMLAVLEGARHGGRF